MSELQQEFTPEDKQLLQRLLFRPMLLPPEFKSWLYKFASTDAAPHFQEILGTRSRRWRIATPVLPLEYTTSVTYADLATVGPQLTGLENGTYMVIFGFYTQGGGSGSRYCQVQYNDQTAVPPPSPQVDIVTEGQAVMFHLVELKHQNNNKMTMKYRVPVSNGGFSTRWLHAVQVG
jgi:hypothetical protein